MPRWHRYYTEMDMALAVSKTQDYEAYSTISRMSEDQFLNMNVSFLGQTSESLGDKRSKFSKVLADKFWIDAGRPTWLIDAGTAEVLGEVEPDFNIEEVPFPPVVCMAFERGFQLKGRPLRSALVFSGKETVSREWFGNFLKSRAGDRYLSKAAFAAYNDLCVIIFDCGGVVSAVDGEAPLYSEDAPLQICDLITVTSRYTDITKHVEDRDALTNLKMDEQHYIEQATRLVLNACLLKHCKEEVVSHPDLTDKKDKMQFPVKLREKLHRFTLPSIMYIREPRLQTVPDSSQRSHVAHIRGWALKTLRHERYRRNADGSPRTILVPPHWVNKHKMDVPTSED
jgi:hypothetical protein